MRRFRAGRALALGVVLWTNVVLAARDRHSHGNPEATGVRHIQLDLTVDFARKQLHGTAVLDLDRRTGDSLVLDTRDLAIESVEAGRAGGPLAATPFVLGERDDVLGSPLRIELPPGADRARITYRTSPGATALQWVQPAGTAGGKRPFLFSQSQSIHARSWVPCQDSPGARVTYDATIHVPEGFTAVMSADRAGGEGNTFRFRMAEPIPPYLIALAVGDLAMQSTGPRSGVWAEPQVAPRAADEFRDTDPMIQAAEKRFGPYRWGRYDILVLPPSFPFGGMENAKLTFATPTVLAGDRSLVSLIAHELAHSWSGNLATCATWDHFWLNEGVTTYLERRIIEDLFGADRAAMEWAQGQADLAAALNDHEPAEQRLQLDLTGRDPDSALNQIPYEKGALFLRRIEEAFGRDGFDAFLRDYFDHFAFKSLTTGDFEQFLRDRLFPTNPQAARSLDLDAWLRQPGLPADAPRITSERFKAVEVAARKWLEGATHARDLPYPSWSTWERVHFLRQLPIGTQADRLAELDAAFNITEKSNAEVAVPWFLHTIRAGYKPADARLEAFLTTVGRNKFLRPLYEELAKTPAGKARAQAIYARARPAYHPLTVEAVSRILGTPPG